jgi:hypothetical protein
MQLALSVRIAYETFCTKSYTAATAGGCTRTKLLSSSGAIVITPESEDRAAWVCAGQVYERLASKTTSLKIKSGFLKPLFRL